MAESSNSSSTSAFEVDDSSSTETKNQTLGVRKILNTLIPVDSQLYMFLYALSLMFDGNNSLLLLRIIGQSLGIIGAFWGNSE